jgi:hypothetical protein
VATLEGLRERRKSECRLTPDGALRSIDDAEAFLRDRDSHARPTRRCRALRGVPRGGVPPRKRRLRRQAAHEVALVRRGRRAWSPRRRRPSRQEPALSIEARTRSSRTGPPASWIRSAVLSSTGCAPRPRLATPARPSRRSRPPSTVDDLQLEPGLKPRELKSLGAPRERCGAVVSRSGGVTAGSGHWHSSELARWDQVHTGIRDVGVHLHHALGELLVAGNPAAVVAPEAELERWFSRRWECGQWLVDELVHGRLRRIDGHVAVGGD